MGRLFEKVIFGLNTLASLWVCVLMFLITADIVSRNIFGVPIQGAVEIVKLSVVGMTWAMAAYTLRSGGHLRSNLLLPMMPRWLRVSVLVANCIVGAGIMLVASVLGFHQMVDAYAVGSYEGAPPVKLAIWPVWALLSLGSGLTAIQFLLDTIRIARFGPSDQDDAGMPEKETA